MSFRLVSSVHEGLEARLDQLDQSTAQHDLLAEEVGLGLLLEGRVEHTGARRADRPRVCERGLLGLARLVTVHRDESGYAAAVLEGATYEVTRALRGDHPHVDTGGRLDLAEVDVEPVGERERVAL